MAEIIRMTHQQASAVYECVHRHCANCVDGNCLLLDDGDFVPCPQLITRSLLCRYFINAVLPGDRQLYGDIFGSPYARPCRECKPIVYRRNARERKRRGRCNMSRF